MTPSLPQEQHLLRAEEAKWLLQHPLLQGALATLREECQTGWRNTAPTDNTQRESFYWLMTAIDEFEMRLTRHIDTGKIVAKDLRDEAYRESMTRDENPGVTFSYGGTPSAHV